MKEKDLKKPIKEEKPGLVNKSIQIILIFINLLFLSTSFAQVPINGFARYREFSTKPNNANIFSLDYNNDGYRDLILFNPKNNNYISHTANQNSDFSSASEKTSQFAISAIHPFGSESSAKKFLILSRKTRQAGIAYVSANGSFSITNKVSLNGFASSIDVNTVPGGGKPEGLVSGSSLNGIYILNEGKHGLEAKRVIEGKIFSSACFIDLDYDSNPDIAAVDPLSNSIIFYYNKYGDFKEANSIGLNGEITEFRAVDFNSDGFTDLAYLKENHIEILIGDSVSSFKKKIILDTPVKVDKYAILDFNGDGYNDIAYINTQLGELYISFARGQNSFYPPILYMKKNGLTDLTAYIDRAGRKLAALSKDGKIFLINGLGIDLNSFSITLGIKPTATQTFDYLGDRYKDFCFIDEGEQALKLFLSERRNLFRTYFKIPLLAIHSELKVDDSKESIKTFFCYTKGSRAIEVVRIDFDTQKYLRMVLYTDGSIEDLKLSNDRLKDRENIFALVQKDKQLYLQNIELRDFQNAFSSLDLISNDYEKAWLTFNVYKEIFLLVKKTGHLELNKIVFDKKILETQTVLSFNISGKDVYNYDFIGLDDLIDRAKPDAFLITINKKSEMYFISKNQIRKYILKNLLVSGINLEYYYDDLSDEILFYYMNSLRNKLACLFIGPENNLKDEKDVIESKPVNNYFVTDIYKRRIFLIYTDDIHNTLTFEKVK
jgi:hypothetical protein